MKRLFFTALAGAAASALIATAASAATIITPFIGGPFSLINPLGTLPAVAMLKKNTYDFTFTMVPPLAGSSSQVQLQAQAQIKPFISEIITFDLYSGTPGTGSFLNTSSTGTNALLLTALSAGNYYVEVKPAYIASNKEVSSGSIVTSIPEPATWGLMLLGFGIAGTALRRRTVLAAA